MTILPLPFTGEEHQPFRQAGGPAAAFFIHGFMGTPAEMRPLANRLHAAGWTTQGILLPGFGPDIVRLSAMRRSDWVSDALTAWRRFRQQHAHAVLVGYSMGGAVALHLASMLPADQVVLLAPFWSLGGWVTNLLLPPLKHVVRDVAPLLAVTANGPAERAQLQEWFPGIDLDDPVVKAELRKQLRLPTAVVDEVRQLGLEAHRRARKVKASTLVIQGRNDLLVRPSATRALLPRLGGPLRYVEVGDDHNFVRLNGPAADEVADTIVQFLQPSATTLQENA